MNKNETIVWAILIALSLPLMVLCTNFHLISLGFTLVGISMGLSLSRIIRHFSKEK